MVFEILGDILERLIVIEGYAIQTLTHKDAHTHVGLCEVIVICRLILSEFLCVLQHHKVNVSTILTRKHIVNSDY